MGKLWAERDEIEAQVFSMSESTIAGIALKLRIVAWRGFSFVWMIFMHTPAVVGAMIHRNRAQLVEADKQLAEIAEMMPLASGARRQMRRLA